MLVLKNDKFDRHSYTLAKTMPGSIALLQKPEFIALEWFMNPDPKYNEDDVYRGLMKDLRYVAATLKQEFHIEVHPEYSKSLKLHFHNLVIAEPKIKKHLNTISARWSKVPGVTYYVKPVTDLQVYQKYAREYNTTDKLKTDYLSKLFISQAKLALREGDTNH